MIAPIRAKRTCVYFHNLNDLQGTAIYIGKHDLDDPAQVLSIANGIPLAANTGTFVDPYSYDAWYGITANGALVRLLVIETIADGD